MRLLWVLRQATAGFSVDWSNGDSGTYIIDDSYQENRDESRTDVQVEEADCID